MSPYQRLWAADPAAWRTAAAVWRTVPELIDRRRGALLGAGDRLRSGWAGPAGRAADGRLSRFPAELLGCRPACIEVDQVLTELAAGLERARALLVAVVAAADDAGVLVDRYGRVSRDPAVSPMAGDAGQTVRAVAARIAAALLVAEVADRAAAARLAALAEAAETGWTHPPGWPTGIGPQPSGPAAAPAAVRAWWDGLDPAQRRWLIAHEPARIGGLDGVPVGARDQANRLLLAQWRAGWPPAGADASAGLDALADRLAADTPRRAYLVALDPAGDGRAVVALGDPDRAEHVVSYVPGTMADLPGIGSELVRADRLADACATEARDRSTATVLWLDYDAPDSLVEATTSSWAAGAGPALHRFQDGLRASHDGPPADQTVVGYSYGALTVGAAAREHGLAADKLVLLGAPGVGVDRAGELGLPADQIWAGTARDDPIQYAALAPGELAERLAVGAVAPLAAGPLAPLAAGTVGPLVFGGPADDLWFGRNPADPAFGAQPIPTGPGGHGGYWEPGGPALAGIAQVATRP
nr:alpha/beta hydrolase [Micromonospora sp. DSM 115978]